MSFIGTSIIHTSLKELHECMPFIAVQHPLLYNTQSPQPTMVGTLVNGVSSLLSNVPLSITVDVGFELDGYTICHFDVISNRVCKLEFHYFCAKTYPFPQTKSPAI